MSRFFLMSAGIDQEFNGNRQSIRMCIEDHTGLSQFTGETRELILKQEYDALKAEIEKIKEAVNGLETLQYDNPNVRQDAYNKGVMDCTNRMNRVLSELKDFKEEI